MKKKYLGFILLIYLLIIIYLIISSNLSNILGPQMHIYIMLSILPLILMSITFLVNKKINYEFKTLDIILLIPLIMVIMSGDFHLSVDTVNNKSFKINKEYDMNDEESDIDLSKIDISKIDYDVSDESYAGVSDKLTYTTNYNYYIGKTIRLRGISLKSAKVLKNGYFLLGKYLINCCAADAEFASFLIHYDTSLVEDDTWYEIEGVLNKMEYNDSTSVIGIEVKKIKKLDKKLEKQYIYPCYAYNDTCKELSSFNLK